MFILSGTFSRSGNLLSPFMLLHAYLDRLDSLLALLVRMLFPISSEIPQNIRSLLVNQIINTYALLLRKILFSVIAPSPPLKHCRYDSLTSLMNDPPDNYIIATQAITCNCNPPFLKTGDISLVTVQR
jgi:hypothetical protein